MFKEITLEVSLKPFKKTDKDYIYSVIEQIYDQWKPLLKNRKQISFMLWPSDGSEIIDYTGDLDKEFNWCCYAGTANKPLADENDPYDLSLHQKKRYYMDNPPVFTYRILKDIVSAFKEVGSELYPHAKITVGNTFDIGPEFAVSDFKYNRHREILSGNAMGEKCFINSYGILKADDYPYAGFPEGIPEGTPFGTLLGRQAQIFLSDLGFDYLWLSNGVGFCAESWNSTGVIFDGKNFHPKAIDETREKVFSFWENFRAQCPDFPIRTRGTNFSAGLDYASDAVCLYQMYKSGLNIVPPPNIPTAALHKNYGIELMGHMSRICELPGDDFMFRYYLHDPWWINSPWYDRYNGQPHDIYMPMAISRIDENGDTKTASLFSLLTIDNTFGDMPDHCVNESIPHFLKAEKNAADRPAPLTWIYPVREYTTATTEAELRKMYSEDWFICHAINDGLPLSSVVSTDIFIKQDKSIYADTILITPVPDMSQEFEKEIFKYIDNGGQVIFYGSVDYASERFKKAFGLTSAEGVDGIVTVDKNAYPDIFKQNDTPDKLDVNEFVCNGKLNVITSNQGDYTFRADGYALSAEYKSAVWCMGLIGTQGMEFNSRGHYISVDGSKFVKGENIVRRLMEKYGYKIQFAKPTGAENGNIFMIHRSDNGVFLSVYSENTTVETNFKFPLGAPIFDRSEALLVDGMSNYRFDKAEHLECRVFVQQQSGIIKVEEYPPVNYKYKRYIKVHGLENATVRFFGEEYCKHNVTAWQDGNENLDMSIINSSKYGTYLEVRNVTGTLMVAMPFPERMEK